MPWQFGEYNRRPFQYLFFSMEYHYKESEKFYNEIHKQDALKPEEFNQYLWMKEKAESRACLVSGVAGIEAFANTVLKEFSLRKKEDMSEEILNKHQRKKPIDRWRLIDKVYFLPTLCNKQLTPPAFYFKKDSEAFKLFDELIQIRNSMMHGRLQPALMLFKLRPNKIHLAYDDIDLNFWPMSKAPRDLNSFNYECAKIAYNNISWVRDSLVEFLENIDKRYLSEEKIQLKSPIIMDDNLDKDELLRNWKKYINNINGQY